MMHLPQSTIAKLAVWQSPKPMMFCSLMQAVKFESVRVQLRSSSQMGFRLLVCSNIEVNLTIMTIVINVYESTLGLTYFDEVAGITSASSVP